MRKEREVMFNRYSSRLMSQGKARKQYLGWVQDFLDYTEDVDLADEDMVRLKVQSFMKKMQRKHGYNLGSMRVLWAIIRAFFNRNALIWPFGRGEAPQVSEPEINAPPLHPDTVNEMIAAVREQGSDHHRVVLALSSVYGMRRSEIRTLAGMRVEEKKVKDPINLKDKILYVATLKHGRARSHLIPDEIVPVLKGYDFSRPLSDSYMTQIWYEMEYMTGITHYPHIGYHSIRRTLTTILTQHFQDAEVKMFLRWKQKGTDDMLMSYAATTFIGRDGQGSSMMAPKLSTLDQRIFEKHPFLPAWGINEREQ